MTTHSKAAGLRLIATVVGVVVVLALAGSLILHYMNTPAHFSRQSDHVRHLLLPHAFVVVVTLAGALIGAYGWSHSGGGGRARFIGHAGILGYGIPIALAGWSVTTMRKAGYDVTAIDSADAVGLLLW